jgi:hypothetical protein
MSAAAKILDRLDYVRPTAPGKWVARCPAHEDRSPSLSIRQLDDGRVLLYDFGGCETEDVLTALGLTMSDLFEKPLAQHFKSSQSRIPARDLLEVISAETGIVAIIAADFLDRRAIADGDWQRLAQAAARIGAARDHAHHGR